MSEEVELETVESIDTSEISHSIQDGAETEERIADIELEIEELFSEHNRSITPYSESIKGVKQCSVTDLNKNDGELIITTIVDSKEKKYSIEWPTDQLIGSELERLCRLSKGTSSPRMLDTIPVTEHNGEWLLVIPPLSEKVSIPLPFGKEKKFDRVSIGSHLNHTAASLILLFSNTAFVRKKLRSFTVNSDTFLSVLFLFTLGVTFMSFYITYLFFVFLVIFSLVWILDPYLVNGGGIEVVRPISE